MARLVTWISSWWNTPNQQQIKLSEQDAVSRVIEWTSASKSLSVVVIGKTGAGKSTLINSLIGIKVAVEGKQLRAQTTSVKPHSVHINGVNVTLWDTPGLRDPLVMTDPKETIDMIAQGCKHYDLLLYCIPMNDRRLANDDVDAVNEITKAFGTSIWENAVVALTYANQLHQPPDNRQEMTAYFTSRHSEWGKVLREVFTKGGISSEMASGIPIVPTGHKECSLPDRTDWFSTFWTAAFLRVKKEAQPAMLIINQDRLVNEDETSKIPVEPHQKPIAVDHVTPPKALGFNTALVKPVIGGAVLGAAVGVFAGALGGPATISLTAILRERVGSIAGPEAADGDILAGMIGTALHLDK